MPFDLALPPKLWTPKPAIIRALSREELVPASFLPGMFPGGAAAAAAGLTTLTKVDEATSTGTTITGPAGIQAGDLLVLLDRAVGIGMPSTAVPTDFNTISNQNDGGSTKQILSYKIATGAEASASLSGMSGIVVRKAMLVFRGDVPIATVAVQDIGEQVTDGNPTAQTVNASGGVVPLVVLGGYGSTGTVDPRTFTVGGSAAKVRWSRLFGQLLRFDKWIVCQG